MKPLPWDYARCNPDLPDIKCRTCARWTGQSWQDYGPRTAVTYALENSSSEHCSYVPESNNEMPHVRDMGHRQGDAATP